jgi:hypothetical protein
MQDQGKSLWRWIGLPVAVAVAGALLGTAAAPSTAKAASVDGWTCYLTDACHAGSAACCDDVKFDHCTTMCSPEPE